jgi:hypothetical protein
MAFETKYLNDWIVVIKCEGSVVECGTGTVGHRAAGRFGDADLKTLKDHLNKLLAEIENKPASA